jgi:hypothetical protein
MSMKFIIAMLIAGLATIIGLGAWYATDRSSFITVTCEIGMGNLSKPDELDSQDIGCAVVGPKVTVSGILITGFEASNFSSEEFKPVKGAPEPGDQRAWFNCPVAGCGAELDQQLSANRLSGCKSDENFEIGMALVVAEGWVTLSPSSGFGHMGRYPREFWATKIIKVGPPRQKMIDDQISFYRENGLCDTR